MRRSGITAALLVMAATAAQAQTAQDMPVSAQYRQRILAGVATRLADGYVNAEKGALIREQLGRKSVRAKYDTLTTASALTTAMTKDLVAWSGDRHLKVVFSVQPRPLPKEGPASPEVLSGQAEQARSRNYGFHALERLTGNIGYIELGRFEAAELAGSTLAAAMQFLANTDALIIDLRWNGGGHADMVALMSSYFLAEQTRLATLERRNAKDNDQIWSASWVPGPRYLGKPVFVLTSSRTFSGAEGLTYDLKHLAGATVVGEKTRGGANPGSFQQIDEHFAVFVPTARVVHAATGGNWDADGIAPDVAVAAADAKRAAHKLAIERLIATQPAAPRSDMWREALADLFPATAK